MFTYDEDHNFSGFWFYNDNDDNSYAVNENGEIIINKSENFNLESGTFVRRIDLNEGEIGKIQSVKNEERIICIAEKATVDGVTILYNENTLEIIKYSDGSKNYVGKYYVEFSDSKGNESQLIVNSDLSGIAYSNKSGYTVVVDNTKNETTGINFNIIVDNDVNKIVYAYRSKNIEYREFYEKATLLGAHLTSKVTEIGEEAFGDCSDLTKVYIPRSVETISKNAFGGCVALTKVYIPYGVTSIGENAFGGCITLTEVTIPSSVTEIGVSAFESCIGLKDVIIFGNIEIINSNTFKYCDILEHVTIPSSVTEIGAGAFDGCKALREVIIPSSVTTIGDLAFFGCENLTEVVINGALTTVGSNAFSICSPTLIIYCDDENTITSISADVEANGYSVVSYPLNNYYTKINN